LFHRLSVAVGRRTVRADSRSVEKTTRAALLVSGVVAFLIVGLSFVGGGFVNPAGQIQRFAGAGPTGPAAGCMSRVDGVLHPALNLASAPADHRSG